MSGSRVDLNSWTILSQIEGAVLPWRNHCLNTCNVFLIVLTVPFTCIFNCTPSPRPSIHFYFTGLLVLPWLKEEVWFGYSSRAPHCHLLLPGSCSHKSFFLRLNGGLSLDNAIIFPPYFTVDALNFVHLSAKQFSITQWMTTLSLSRSLSLFRNWKWTLRLDKQAPEWKWMWIL